MFEILAQCANVEVPPLSAEALRYYNSDNILWIIQLLWGFILPALFLFTRFSGILGTLSKKIGRNWFFTIATYLILFTFFYELLNFPLDIYADFFRQHAYGLSTQSLSSWFKDYGMQILVTLISSLAFVWIFYLLVKKSPKQWWFYSSLASSLILFFMMMIQPIWIDPLFNHFGPMKNKHLETQILSLANKAGISGARVFEVDKSSQTTMLNAYVTGFGSTKRIVLWDTTLQKLSPDQVLFVMGHEMGHYVLHHIWWEFLYFSLLSFLIFYLTYKSSKALLNRFSKQFGFSHLYDIASLPLFILLFGFFIFLFSPLTNYISRTIEHQADIFGLEITKNNEAAASAFVVLQKSNLGNPFPGPIYTTFRATHPALGERIEFCNHYCPWKDKKT